MATYGDIRFRLSKLFPGVDPAIRDAAIDDRYFGILDRLPWERLRVEAVLQTVAPYETGTVEVTAGSTAITTTGVWDASWAGRRIRITGRDEWYTLAYSAPNWTLDRAYEGTSDTVAAYRIFQHIYALPAGAKIIEEFHPPDWQMEKTSHGQLNASAPSRSVYGTPQYWAPYMDDASDPPVMQVELYPVPDSAIGIPYSYFAEKTALSAGQTSATLLPWMRPAALVAGATADILRSPAFKDYTGAREHDAVFEARVGDMLRNEAANWPPSMLELPGHYTSHRTRRWKR